MCIRPRNDRRLVDAILTGGALSVQLGAFSASYVGGLFPKVFLAVLLVGMGIVLLFREKGSHVLSERWQAPMLITSQGCIQDRSARLRALTIGLIGGFVSGLVGVSGGFFSYHFKGTIRRISCVKVVRGKTFLLDRRH